MLSNKFPFVKSKKKKTSTSLVAGGTNSATATGRRFKISKNGEMLNLEEDYELADEPSVPGGSNTVTGRLIGSWVNVFLDRFADEDNRRTEREGYFFANLQLVRMLWGLFWEELKLKYARMVDQMDEVEEGDVLTLSFLGVDLFGKFRLYPT